MVSVPPETDDQRDEEAGSVGLVDAISDAVTSRWIGPLLVVGWIGLLIAGTQFPQRLSPLVTADGLTPADIRSLTALGLASIGDSMALWLLAGATVVVFLGRALTGGGGKLPSGSSAAASLSAAAVESALAEVLARDRFGRLAQITSHGIDGGRRLVIGRRRLGIVLLGTGLALWGGTIVAAAEAPAPVLLEVPVTAKRERAPLVPTTPGPGRRVKAVGHFEGACSREGNGLRCDLEGFGESDSVLLKPGSAARIGAWTATWTHSRIAPDASSWNLRWWLPSTSGKPGWFSFDTASGRHASAASLGISVTALRTVRSGPIVLGTIAGKPGRAILAAGPGLLPDGAPHLRAGAGGRAAILLSRPVTGWPMFAGCLTLLLGIFLAFVVPSVELDITAHSLRVKASNRDELVVAADSALAALAEGGA